MIGAASQGFRRTFFVGRILPRALFSRSGLNCLSTESGQDQLAGVGCKVRQIVERLCSAAGKRHEPEASTSPFF
jgi:hypothetical protein